MKLRLGISALIGLVIIAGTALTVPAQGAQLASKPVSSRMPAISNAVTFTSTTEAPQVAHPLVIERPNIKTTTPNRKTVKPASKPSTTTTEFKAEVEDMADAKTPLQIAQSMVGQPSQWGNFWCAKFVDAVAQKANVPNWISEDGPAELFNDALRDNRVHPLPRVGDMGFVDLRDPSEKAPSDIPDVQVMHVFLVSAVNGNEYSTIEGNADDSQLVVRKVRHVDDGYTIAFASFPF